MVFKIIGLGLGNERDITVKGLEAIQNSHQVYLEHYTAILGVDVDTLSAYYKKEVIVADRELVELEAEEKLLLPAKEHDICLLVVGDPFGATTHTDLLIRAKQLEIPIEVIHNTSILNAVGCCGLQLYRFGQTISMVFFTEQWRPDSFYDKLAFNYKNNLHSLLLLDIKVKEQSIENMARGRKIYEPPRYMTIQQCMDQLIEVEGNKQQDICPKNRMAIGLARIGHPDQCIRYGTLTQLQEFDFGGPLHSVILPAELHEIEKEFLEFYRI